MIIDCSVILPFLIDGQYIDVATGVEAGVNRNLKSSTSEIDMIRVTFTDYDIVFVDTPSFGDTKRSDFDTLKIISDWLGITYVVPECTEDAADL